MLALAPGCGLLRFAVALLVAMTPLSGSGAEGSRPPILQITIERLASGKETEYGALEEELALLCARLRCPNSYLALLSLDAPKEVWWLVSYESQADVERVAAGYASNLPLLDAMRALTARKEGLAAAPIEHWTKLRADLSDSAPWDLGVTPFAAIATRAANGGAVYETAEQQRFAIAWATTRAGAEELAARLGPTARVLEVRPTWSQPASEWVLASPALWAAR